MPIYEYQCSKCGVFEVTQRITEDPLKKCPTCNHKVQKLISNTSFQLKGTGWYITDYGRGSGSDGEKSESKVNGKSESSDSTSTKKSPGEKSSGEKSSGEKSSGEKSSGEKSTSSANPSS